MKFLRIRRLPGTIFAFLVLSLVNFSTYGQSVVIPPEPFRPTSVLKIDPSHLIFPYAQGLMAGYESRFDDQFNWSLELGKALHENTGVDPDIKSGYKIKVGLRKYILHTGKKRYKTRYIGIGLFYDNHTMTELGRQDDGLFNEETYTIKRSAAGVEIINGMVLPLGSNVFIEAYGVLRSSLRYRDHMAAPETYLVGGGYFFQGTRREGTKWRVFHAMVGFKLSFVLN